jgi:hypothetical protein
MNKTLCIMSVALGALCLLTSCTHDADIVSLGIENYYYLPRMKKLLLQPAYEGNAYRWTLAVASGADSVLSTGKNFIFMAEKEGTYHLTFHLDDGGRGLTHHFPVTVVHEDVEYSPYTAKVYDFHPAPRPVCQHHAALRTGRQRRNHAAEGGGRPEKRCHDIARSLRRLRHLRVRPHRRQRGRTKKTSTSKATVSTPTSPNTTRREAAAPNRESCKWHSTET